MKICTTCKKEKQHEDFYNSKSTKDKLSYRCRDCDKESGKKYRKLHKERDRISRKWSRIKSRYGLSKEEYKELFYKHDGYCPICNNKMKEGWSKNHHKNRAVIDHCHTTNKVRGVICTMCNKGIGLLGDNSENVEKALEYLKNTEVH